MNISSLQAYNTNFGCNDPACQNCTCRNPQPTPQADIVEISTAQKVKNACKKGFNFVKTNKTGILATGKAALSGLLTSCTILGANQLMQKVSKADTSSLAGKLAIIGGVAVAAGELIKNRKAFNKAK